MFTDRFFNLKDVASIFKVDKEEIQEALAEWKEKNEPEQFYFHIDKYHVLYIAKINFASKAFLRLGRKWGKHVRLYSEYADGDLGKWFWLIELDEEGASS